MRWLKSEAMSSIFQKELSAFFSSLIGYIVIGVFLTIMGLVVWVFPDTSLLNYQYATLNQLFDLAPIVFMLLIPAITMRMFAEEQQSGTFELLVTRPLTDLQIVLGKYLATLVLVLFSLLPTVLYYYTVWELGSPKGNIDSGAVLGSYIGLVFLAAAFSAIGIFASALSQNQIVAFILSVFLCFLIHWGFDFLSRLPVFVGKWDSLVEMLGMEYHYASVSRGLLDTRDLLYFLSIAAFFLAATLIALDKRRW